MHDVMFGAIRPALYELERWSGIAATFDAAMFILRVCAVESDSYKTTCQYRGGPARSWAQIEPRWGLATLKQQIADRRPERQRAVMAVLHGLHLSGKIVRDDVPEVEERALLADALEVHQVGAMMLCRLMIRTWPENIPSAIDLKTSAKLWKSRYNTESGKGTLVGFRRRCDAVVEPAFDLLQAEWMRGERVS